MIILHFHLQPQFKNELFHIYFIKEFVLSCACLRPSLKSTLTGALFYIPPPLGVIFAPPILQSPWFTGDPTQRGN